MNIFEGSLKPSYYDGVGKNTLDIESCKEKLNNHLLNNKE